MSGFIFRRPRTPQPAEVLNFLDPTAAIDFDLVPETALSFFKAKGLKPTFDWRDMIGSEHDSAFTVAKMMDIDLLGQVRGQLEKAIANGDSFDTFAKNIIPELQKAGWWGRQAVTDPVTGQLVNAQLGSPHRLRTIFRSNLQSAYSVGAWEEIEINKEEAPYLLYEATDDFRVRPEHKALDNIMLPVDDPRWDSIYPPNGWNCRCTVIQMSDDDIEDLGITPSKPPKLDSYQWKNPRTGKTETMIRGIDPGWNHNPGKRRYANLKKLEQEKAAQLPPDMQKAVKAGNKAKADQEAAQAVKQAAMAKAIKDAETQQAKQAEIQKQDAAQKAINQAQAEGTPYLAKAIKQVKATKKAQTMLPTEILDAAIKKAENSKKISDLNHYKNAIIGGKVPGKQAQKAFDALPDAQQAKIAQEIADKSGATAALQELADIASSPQANPLQKAALDDYLEAGNKINNGNAKDVLSQIKIQAAEKLNNAAINEPAPADTPLNFANMEQIGPQRGSNAGGLYRDRTTGLAWYIKTPASQAIADNEILAAKLYELAGVDAPELRPLDVDGQYAIASRYIEGTEEGTSGQLAKAKGSHEGFVTDAWLANWDVVGLSNDNLLIKDGKAYRIDVGGSLVYRAQGGEKGSAFGEEVRELDTLRNPADNSQAASVFGNITTAKLDASALRVIELDETDIRDTVMKFGPGSTAEKAALADKLIARKKNIETRFSHLVNQEQAEAPADAGSRVTINEHLTIQAARQNGYMIPTDKDLIEDHNVTLWHEQIGGGRTHLQTKLTPKGQTIIDGMTKGTSGEVTVHSIAAADALVVAAIKGIRAQANQGNTELRAVDQQRLREADRTLRSVQNEINDLFNAGRIAEAEWDRLDNHYSKWKLRLKAIAQSGRTDSYDDSWEDFTGLTPKAPKPTGAAPAISFTKTTRHEYKLRTIERGLVTQETGGEHQRMEIGTHTVYVADVDGAKIRYWPTESKQFAIGGRIEIIKNGTERADSEAVMETLEKLGIDAARETAADREELYLIRSLYHLRKQPQIDEPDQEMRIRKLRAKLESAIGVTDITAMPGYKPAGVYGGFGHNARHQYRPDVETAEFQQFRKTHVLAHRITDGGLVTALQNILNSGGMMAPTTDKLRRGIPVGGMSPEADMASGGADYFFTRIKKGEPSNPGLYWDAIHVARLDTISYDSDRFGRTTDDNVIKGRRSTIAEWKQAAGRNDNETNLKGGVSLFDQLRYIQTDGPSQRQEVIKLFKKNKIDRWPDGRSLEEVIK